MLLQRIQ
jgi:hypothetical protein